MAKQPIDKNELLKSGALEAIIKDFDQWLKKLKEVDTTLDEIKKSAEIKPPKNTEDYAKLTAKIEQLEKALKTKVETDKKVTAIEKERLSLSKKLEKAQAQKTLATSKENKELKKLKKEKKETNKAGRDEEKQLKRNKNAYTKLSDESREFKNESKRLGAELLDLEKAGKKDTAQFKKLEKQFGGVTAKARKTDGQLKKLDSTVGDNQRKVGNYENATSKLSGAMGALGIAAGVGGAVTAIFNLNRELSKAENVASNFFDTTEAGNKSIAREASTMAKVFGKDVNEVLRSANVLSKQFGISGEKSLSILNSGFEKGADVSGELLTNVSEYSTQLRLAGLSAEQSIAIITESQQAGVFSDKGIDSIKEATLSLREMTPVTREALDAIGMSADQVQKDIANGSKSYFDVIQEISTKTGEVGEKSEAAGMIFADIFKGAGEDAGDFVLNLGKINTDLGELEDQNKGLEGAVQNLVRSWSEFTQGLSDSTNTTGILSGTLNFLADNLVTIIKWVAVAATGFLAYQGVLIATKVVTVAYAFVTNAFALAQGLMTGSISLSTIAMKLFNKTTKMNPLGALIGVIMAVVVALGLFSLATDKQTEATKKLKEEERLKNDQLERGLSLAKTLAGNQKDIAQQMKLVNSLNQVELKNLKSLIKAQLSQVQGIETTRKARGKDIKDFREAYKQTGIYIALQKELTKITKDWRKTSRDNSSSRKEKRELFKEKMELENYLNDTLKKSEKAEINRILKSETGISLDEEQTAKLEKLKEQLKEVNSKIVDNTGATDDNTDAADANADAKDRQKEAQDRYNKSLEHSLKIQQKVDDLEEIEVTESIAQAARETEDAIDDEVQAIEDGNFSILMNYKERMATLLAVVQDEINLRELNAKNAFEFDKSVLESEKERINEQNKLRQTEKNSLQSKDSLTEGEEQRLKELTKLLTTGKNRVEIINLDIEKLETEHQITMNDIAREGGEKKLKTKKEVDDKLLAKDKKSNDEEKDLKKESNSKAVKELTKSVAESANLLKTLYDDAIDQGIESQNRLISNSQKTINMIENSAKAGTSQAKQSILAEEKAIEESQKRIEKAQKRKATMKIISGGIDTFNQQIANDKPPLEALGTTAASMTGLIAMLSALPSFDVGADRLTEKGQGIDNKKGFLSINHPDERIMTEKQNRMIGFDTSNSDITKVMNYYNQGLLTPDNQSSAVVVQNDNTEILNRIDNGFSKINNWNMNAEELFGTITVMIEQSKNGDIHRSKKKFKS